MANIEDGPSQAQYNGSQRALTKALDEIRRLKEKNKRQEDLLEARLSMINQLRGTQ